MFAGIGGFRSGLSHYGDFFVPVGYCEIDPYAKRAYEAIYEPKGEIYFEDARGIIPESLPDIDLICGGFPCQSFSIAGKRGGFEDARGTLFFEIARIARVKRSHFLLLENVPGLLSHDGCRTFATILDTLDELGYHVAWQVLAVLFFIKVATAYLDYRKHGQFEWTAPAILLGTLVFSLPCLLYIWKILGM